MKRAIQTRVLIALLGATLCGFDVSHAQQAAPVMQEALDGPALIRLAKKSQDWMMHVKSFYVKFEDGEELAFDPQRLFFKSRAMPNGWSNKYYWDGKLVGSTYREGFFELKDSSENVMRSFMTSGFFGRFGQIYWWSAGRERTDDFVGPPERFVIAGRAPFHDVDCYEVVGPAIAGSGNTHVYVGATDHRLFGLAGPMPERTFLEYKEISEACWYPMLQDGRRVSSVVLDQQLPDELFKPDIKEGTHVSESIGGKSREYVFHSNQSPDEQAEIDANAARQALFGPPPMPPGPVVLGRPVEPLPLNPLALNPAAEFPESARWLNGAPVKLADLRGKVVLIVFWASWHEFSAGLWGNTQSPPDMKMLEDIKNDIAVVGVHVPTKDTAKVEKAIKQNNFSFPVCIDVPAADAPQPWGTMAAAYRLDELSTTYVIDQSGRIAALENWSGAVRRAHELLDKAPPPTSRPNGGGGKP